MKHITACLILLFLITGIIRGQEPPVYKVGVFVPLYLDSAFTETGTYRFGKGFPRQSLPGLEFYLGTEMAIDSLQQERQERFQQAVQQVMVENQELLQRLALVEAEEKVEVLEPREVN